MSIDTKFVSVFYFLNEMSSKDVNIFPRGKSSSNPLFGRRWLADWFLTAINSSKSRLFQAYWLYVSTVSTFL